MAWAAGDVMGQYVAVPMAGPPHRPALPGMGTPAGPVLPPDRVPVPPSDNDSVGASAPGSGISGRVPSAAAPPLGSRRGFTGEAPELFEHPDFPGHTPLALFRALLGRTRMHHASIREQMVDFEDWLDNMIFFRSE